MMFFYILLTIFYHILVVSVIFYKSFSVVPTIYIVDSFLFVCDNYIIYVSLMLTKKICTPLFLIKCISAI